MGHTFRHLCKFWVIMHEVCLVYYVDRSVSTSLSGTVPFAEYKFRELLAWSNNLPSHLSRSDHNPHHVLILQ